MIDLLKLVQLVQVYRPRVGMLTLECLHFLDTGLKRTDHLDKVKLTVFIYTISPQVPENKGNTVCVISSEVT